MVFPKSAWIFCRIRNKLATNWLSELQELQLSFVFSGFEGFSEKSWPRLAEFGLGSAFPLRAANGTSCDSGRDATTSLGRGASSRFGLKDRRPFRGGLRRVDRAVRDRTSRTRAEIRERDGTRTDRRPGWPISFGGGTTGVGCRTRFAGRAGGAPRRGFGREFSKHLRLRSATSRVPGRCARRREAVPQFDFRRGHKALRRSRKRPKNAWRRLAELRRRIAASFSRPRTTWFPAKDCGDPRRPGDFSRTAPDVGGDSDAARAARRNERVRPVRGEPVERRRAQDGPGQGCSRPRGRAQDGPGQGSPRLPRKSSREGRARATPGTPNANANRCRAPGGSTPVRVRRARRAQRSG